MRSRIRTTVTAGVAALAVVALAACAGAADGPPAAGGPALAGLGSQDVLVGLAFDSGGRGDKSFNDAAAAGLDRAKEQLRVTATEVSPAEETDEARAVALRDLAAAGHNPVIAVGFLYATTVAEVAREFPDTTFAVIDDDSITEPNVASLVFAEEQGSFLVGAAAALRSRTGRVGYIGGVRSALLGKFEAGFVAGAKRVRPGVTVDVAYLSEPPDFSGFGAPDKARRVATRMLDDGADVIYAAAGGSGTGALEAVAARRGAWFVGVDSDQYASADPQAAPVVLTSMIKRVDNAVFQQIQGFIKGARGGGVRRFDLKTDGVGYAVSNEAAIAPISDELERLRLLLHDGTITVPTTP